MRETTKNKIRDFKDAATAKGFEVKTETSKIEGNDSFGLLARRGDEGEVFVLGWGRDGTYSYVSSGYVAPGAPKIRRIRNLSEAFRILASLPAPANEIPTDRKGFAAWAKKNIDITADNKIGYEARRILTPLTPTFSECSCDRCGFKNSVTAVVALVTPIFRTFPEISLRKIEVRFEGVCDRCAEKAEKL